MATFEELNERLRRAVVRSYGTYTSELAGIRFRLGVRERWYAWVDRQRVSIAG